MSQFIRMIDHDIIDLFVQQAEDSGYCRDQFLKDSPYLLGNRELECLFRNIPEETSDCLAVAEAFCNGNDVVLYAAQCRGGDLRGEAGALAFAETRISLAVLEDDFKSPASGVYLPCLEEFHSCIGCKQSVPFTVSCTAYKEKPYRDTYERGIKHDTAASEFAAVLLQLELFPELHKSRGCEIAVPGVVSCLAFLTDLYHAEPMAFSATAMDVPDNLLIGKPAVRQL